MDSIPEEEEELFRLIEETIQITTHLITDDEESDEESDIGETEWYETMNCINSRINI